MLPILILAPPIVVLGGGYWSWSLGYNLAQGSNNKTRRGPKSPPPPPQTYASIGLGFVTLGASYAALSMGAPKPNPPVEYKKINSVAKLEAVMPRILPMIGAKSVGLLVSFALAGAVQAKAAKAITDL